MLLGRLVHVIISLLVVATTTTAAAWKSKPRPFHYEAAKHKLFASADQSIFFRSCQQVEGSSYVTFQVVENPYYLSDTNTNNVDDYHQEDTYVVSLDTYLEMFGASQCLDAFAKCSLCPYMVDYCKNNEQQQQQQQKKPDDLYLVDCERCAAECNASIHYENLNCGISSASPACHYYDVPDRDAIPDTDLYVRYECQNNTIGVSPVWYEEWTCTKVASIDSPPPSDLNKTVYGTAITTIPETILYPFQSPFLMSCDLKEYHMPHDAYAMMDGWDEPDPDKSSGGGGCSFGRGVFRLGSCNDTDSDGATRSETAETDAALQHACTVLEESQPNNDLYATFASFKSSSPGNNTDKTPTIVAVLAVAIFGVVLLQRRRRLDRQQQQQQQQQQYALLDTPSEFKDEAGIMLQVVEDSATSTPCGLAENGTTA